MTWQALFDEIKNGTLSGIYLFQGPEEFIKRSAIEKIRELLLPAGLEILNETVLEGALAADIIESAETLPVMCDRRLVLVKEWSMLTGAKTKDEAGEAEKFEKWLPGAPESCVIVFLLRGEADKRKKVYKALEKHAKIIDFAYLTDGEIAKWIASRLKPKKKVMKTDAVNALIFLAGRDLTRLSGEVDKLAAFVGDKGEIMKEDVTAAVTPSAESNVFYMIDALVAGDAKRAYEILNAMLDAGEGPIGILAMITRQLRLMTHVKLLRDNGLPLAEIERRCALQHFVAQRVYGQCAKLSAKKLEEGYRAGVESDFEAKSGKIRDRAALDRMMFLLLSISQ